jgi:WD40 repeat protein
VSTGREVARLQHEDRVKKVAFSANGKYLFTLTWEGNFRIWEIATRKEFRQLTNVRDFVLTQDGNNLAIAESNQVTITRPDGSSSQIRIPEGIDSIALSPSGQYVATSEHTNGITRLWEAATGKEIFSKKVEGFVHVVAFSPNSQYLVATGGTPGGALVTHNSKTLVLEVPSGKEIAQISNEVIASSVAFSPDSKYLVTSGFSRVWELETGREVFRLGNKECNDVSFSPNGQHVALSCKDETLQAWQLSSGAEVSRVSLQGEIGGFDISSNGEYIATGGDDGVAKVWETKSGQEISHLSSLNDIWDVKFSPDSQYLAVADRNGDTVYLWKHSDQKKATQINVESVSGITFSPSGRYLATASDEKDSVCLWAIPDAKLITCISVSVEFSSFGFSENGQYLAVLGGSDISVWNVPTMEKVSQMQHDVDPKDVVQDGYGYSQVQFSADSKYLITVANSPDARAWDFRTGKEVARMQNKGGVLAADSSPDGKYLATVGHDHNVRIWDIENGQEITSMLHEDSITGVSFSPDGKYLTTSSYDYTTRVWDVPSGKEISRIKHDAPPFRSQFTPDNKYLVTLSLDEVVHVWPLWSNDLIDEACKRLTQNLSKEEWSQYIGNEPYRKTCPNLP